MHPAGAGRAGRLGLPLLMLAAALVLQTARGFVPLAGRSPASGRAPWQQKQPQAPSRGRPLQMIDNFFRLHEKNRQLNWDDYFGKARYDLPQALGSAAAAAAAAGSVEAAVDEALRQALRQLPACASLDLAVVAVSTGAGEGGAADTDAVLAHLAKVLPGETRVVGWAGPGVGPSAAPTADGMGVGMVSAGGTAVSITLASLPAVKGKGFFVSEDELRAWAAQAGDVKPVGPVNPDDEDGPIRFLGDKKWELRVGVTVNEAYKDPPVFLLLGNLREAALAQVAIQGLDVTYPGTAKVGGLVPPADAEGVVLFSREGGPQGSAGARILKEDAGTPGLLGLALVGDVRTLTYVSQGAEPQPGPGAFRVEAVSEDGQRITAVAPVAGDGAAAVTPKEAGIQDGQGLALGLGNDKPSSGSGKAGDGDEEAEVEGADRWSLVSVRGSRQPAAVVPPGQWRLEGDGSLRLEGRVAKPGQYLSWYKQGADVALAQEAGLVAALEAEIEAEWAKPELGVMKFRPTGVLAVRGRGYPVAGLGDGLGKALARALPTAPVACLEAAGGQWAPLDPARTSALLPDALVLNVLACKAKRRDLREIHFDFRDFGAEAEGGRKPSPLDLPFDVEKPLLDAATGEVAVNRQAALIGTDVRVDNMAWNVREESVLPTSLFESMVWTKERELHFVREEAPLLNLMRTVMMIIKSPDPATQAKAAGLDVAAALEAAAAKSGDGWAVLGEVSRGSPFHGIVGPTYDPGAAAKAMVQHAGAAAVSVCVDQTYYGGKYQHVRDVKDAFRPPLPEGAAEGGAASLPVIASDLILYPYQLYLAKLFGADGVKMGITVLSDEDLLYQIKICKTLSLTPVISVASLAQLQRAAALPLSQTSVIALEDRDQGTMRRHPGAKHPALEWLRDAQVQASLEARRANKGKEEQAQRVGSGGAPLLLVAGRPVEDAAERAELQALGVAGAVVSFVDMPAPVVSEAAAAAAKAAAARPKPAAVDASKLGALFV